MEEVIEWKKIFTRNQQGLMSRYTKNSNYEEKQDNEQSIYKGIHRCENLTGY